MSPGHGPPSVRTPWLTVAGNVTPRRREVYGLAVPRLMQVDRVDALGQVHERACRDRAPRRRVPQAHSPERIRVAGDNAGGRSEDLTHAATRLAAPCVVVRRWCTSGSFPCASAHRTCTSAPRNRSLRRMFPPVRSRGRHPPTGNLVAQVERLEARRVEPAATKVDPKSRARGTADRGGILATIPAAPVLVLPAMLMAGGM